MSEIDHLSIQNKWQKSWDDAKVFKADVDTKKPKFYCLEMFPYPSGSGLHMGHAFNYTIGDLYSRFKRMNGFNVLYPMGYDSFGLPAENAAIKANSHPKIFTESAIKNFIRQQKSLGLSYDWDRLLMTHTPEYYKWNQYIFLEFLKNGLAYRKKSAVNWCPKCNTVLANEQVHNGTCWRHTDTNVELKQLEQWFIKTTKYAEELLNDLEKIDWPKRIKIMQENWIGKSYGTEIEFKINNKPWKIFTTRPDTIYGVTFVVVALQHPKLMELVTPEQKHEVEELLKKVKSTSEKDTEDLEKEGAFTGSYAINPVTQDKVPVYAGNFVVAEYGSGMVMAVPAHDQRDFEFAKKYKIPVKQVITPLFATTEGKDKIRDDKKTVRRKNIIAIIKHWEKNEYFCLDWEKFGWKSFIIGGIEDNETAEETVIREIKEETGYQNFNIIGKVSGEIHSHYFAAHKDENRYAESVCFYVELKDGEHKQVEAEHSKNHKGLWVKKDKIQSYINLNVHSAFWDIIVKGEKAYTEGGVLINSHEFSGLNNEVAKDKITEHLEKLGVGKKTVQYKLRDWLVSRQRYWGTPIPVVYCDTCGIVPAKVEDLPIKLPEDIQFGQGNPILSSKHFVKTTCPKCGKDARRETDTMDTFFDSSWYYLRYTDSKNTEEMFSKEKVNYWLPVDQYIGGAEHACMHLVYARFFTKALRDLGYLSFDEPFLKLFNQGMLHGPDGFVMSKSRGNVVLPETISEKYGIDTARFFLLSLASPDKDLEWSDSGIEGSYRFVRNVFSYFETVKTGHSSKLVVSKLNKAIKEVTDDIENFRYNLGIIKIRKLFESLKEEESFDTLEKFLKLLHPICPHITEELYEKIGGKGFLTIAKWPNFDESLIDEKVEFIEEMEKTARQDIQTLLSLLKITSPKKITFIVSHEWKYEFMRRFKEKIEETRDFKEIITHILLSEDLKRNAQVIQKIIPSLLKDGKKVPAVILDQHVERRALEEIKLKLEEEFKTTINVVLAEDSKEAKANNAMPSKPAILIE